MQRSLWLGRLRLGLLISILIGSKGALASPPPPSQEQQSLASLVDQALKAAQILEAQDAQIEASRLNASQAKAWPGSEVEFQVGQKKSGDETGPRTELGFAQPLPIFGKAGLRSNLSELDSQSWSIRRKTAELSVTRDVIEFATKYALNRQKWEFVSARQKRFQLIHSYLAGRVFATPQRKAERNIVRNRLSLLISDEIQSQAMVIAAQEKLRAYVPLGDATNIALPWFTGRKVLDREQISRSALDNNPGLLTQDLAIKTAIAQSSLLSKERLADPALVASYERSKADVVERNVGVGLQLGFASWNGNRLALKGSRSRIVAEQKLLEFNKAQLTADIRQALVDYDAARRIVLQYPKSVLDDLATELRDAEEGFKKGQIDLLTFLEVDSAAAEAYAHVIDAQLNLAEKIGDLLILSGDRDLIAQIDTF